MLRTSTFLAYASSIANLQRRQGDMTDAQQRLTSGLRVLHASDDPTAAARAERARALMQRAESTQRAVDASRNSMTLTESALANAGELMQQARELIVSAGDASYSDAERADLANQLAEIRKQLMGVANRSDGAGGYVFSGQGSGRPPFLDRPGGVDYVGTGGAVRVASDEPLPLTLDGGEVWLKSPSGNGVFETRNVNSAGAWVDAGRVTAPDQITGSTYSINFTVSGGTTSYSILKDGVATAVSGAPYVSGQAIEIDGMAVAVSGNPADGDSFEMAPSADDLSVFDALDRVVSELKTPSRTGAQVTQTVQNGLRDIDSLSDHLQSTRSMTGEILNRIDGVAGRLDDLKLFGESTRSDAEDLDMVQAISDFQNQQTGYEAALQTYSTMQRMSLFDYIKT
ncbi:flagellar hook-associated protein FlgL [Ideonella sp.]|uniref:flagellar hook-associated protein FlgL n=1 Tax=Ideonella sp. TaxID=1929293 RepID=UPI002B466779|nr:flagellar hook-associated protein FlgL [Ideonella sp.]HJV67972.1 flagellar hook-associated protein FlgL [Ideonella sp.]